MEYGSALNKSNRLILASWWQSWDKSLHTVVGDEFSQKALLQAISSADFFVAHNAKFELQWLDRCGLDLGKLLCYDTMLGEWVIAGNRRIPKDLDSTAKRYGVGEKSHYVHKLIHLGVNPLDISIKALSSYCEQDVRITLGVFRKQLEVLHKDRLLHLQFSRCLLTPVLADMEKNGVTLDKKAVYEEYEKVSAEYKQNQRELNDLFAEVVGDESEINWRSGPQVADFLYDKLRFDELKGRDRAPLRTASGRRATDAGSIGSLKPRTALQRKFQALFKTGAKLSAKLTKSLEFFKEVCDHHDCTFYGIFNQGSTGTHRLSSSGRRIELARNGSEGKSKEIGVQLQNIPREYKRLFRAKRPDWEMVDADGSQLEFRVAADLGHDEVAYKEIDDGADIHTITADTLTQAGEPTDRQAAKSRTFRPLYGGSSGTPAEVAYCEFFRGKYRGIYETQNKWTLEVLGKKELRTPYGLKFYWPDTKMSRSGYITNTTAIFNYPVQGFATGEIIPIAVVHAWYRLRDLNVRFVLTIHDSVVLEIGPDVDRTMLRSVLAECFTVDVYRFLKRIYNYDFWIPMGSEIKIGPVWGSGKGVKAKCYPNTTDIIWS